MAFVLALQFLTRFPSPIRRVSSPYELSAALRWFPAVGAVIGVVVAAVDLAVRPWFAPPVSQALVVAALVMVTGALHLDGLIDAVDGLSTPGGAAERLAAMHQTAAGTMGGLAGFAALLLTFVAVGALPDLLRTPVLVLAPVCGRTAIVLAYAGFPYARSEAGISLALKQGATRNALLVAIGTGLLLVSLAGGPGGAALLVGALVTTYGGGRVLMMKLPGLAGDLYGAIAETTQIGVLLLAPICLRS